MYETDVWDGVLTYIKDRRRMLYACEQIKLCSKPDSDAWQYADMMQRSRDPEETHIHQLESVYRMVCLKQRHHLT